MLQEQLKKKKKKVYYEKIIPQSTYLAVNSHPEMLDWGGSHSNSSRPRDHYQTIISANIK